MCKWVIFLVLAIVILGLGAIRMTAQNNNNSTIEIYNAETGEVEKVSKIVKTEEEWRKILTPEQFKVTRLKGTEAPFSNTCGIPIKGEEGILKCVCCGTDLFKFETKFESGTGWPSFYEPISKLNVKYIDDNTFGMVRTEVLCARCDAHLGHVFNDGPPPSGKRYCMNAASLVLAKPIIHEKATFAAGCFWGVESTFRQYLGKGVISTKVGYTGGTLKNPTYQDVCSDKTGHAEAVEIIFDPAKISFEKLVNIFFDVHDPTTADRQGPDYGSQYRSAIFFHSPDQQKTAMKIKEDLNKSGKLSSPIVTQILPAKEFYSAEEYHQKYYEKKGINPTCNIPKK